MSDKEKINTFHSLAKDAGNKLRAYILAVSSGSVGVFFLTLMNTKGHNIDSFEKWLLTGGLVSFVAVVCVSLYELRKDSNRFYHLAKALEESGPENEQSWEDNKKRKSNRLFLINTSYFFFGLGIILTIILLIYRVW